MQESVPLLVLGLFLIGLTALIAARVSSRWLGLFMLLWTAAPVILMAATLAIGSLSAPANGSTGSNLIFAIMIVGFALLLPWLLICAVGFVIGVRFRRKSAPALPVVDAPRIVAPQPPPTTIPTQVHVAPAMAAPPQRHVTADVAGSHFSHASPDNSIRVDIEPVEWANSQWVHTPRLIEAQSGRILCDMLGSDWEGQTAFPRERYVWLGLRRYRTPGHLFAEFDLDADRYRIALNTLETPDEEGPLGDITDRLELWWQCATALAWESAPPPPPAKPHPFAAWRTALVILGGALVAIAGLTYLSLKTGIEPPSVPILRPGTGVPH